MKPSKAIAMLDRQIAKHGQTIVLRRIVPNGAPVEVTVRGSKRNYSPRDITDGIVIGSSQVILSPSALRGTPFAAETDWPRTNDRVVVDGRLRNVEAVDPVSIDDVVVRFNLVVAG